MNIELNLIYNQKNFFYNMGTTSDKPLEDLITNLEKLVQKRRNQVEDNIIIDNIKQNYSMCCDYFEKFKKNKQIINDNNLITQYLNKVEHCSKKCDSNYFIYFQAAKDLLIKIKVHNENIMKEQSKIYVQDSYIQNNNIQNNSQKEIMMEKQIKKSDVIQVQDLGLLNDNQGRALSALECYSNRFTKNPTNYFDYYNMNNLGNKKDPKQLRGQCIVQTQIFRMAYMDYISKYDSYKIDNLEINKLIHIINEWMKNVKDEDKILYKEMLDIITSINNNISFSSHSFTTYTKDCQHVTMNPQDIASMAPGIYNYNHQRNKESKQNYLKTGKMESKLNIGKSHKDDKGAQLLMEQIKSNKDYFTYEYPLENNGDNK